jgi:hypothetical protein
MHDREDEEDLALPVDQAVVQSLKSVALLLKGLYGQMNEEREIITLASGQMVYAVKQFEHHLTQFETFEKTCQIEMQESLKLELRQSVKEIANTIAQEVADLVYEPMKHSINSLDELITEMTKNYSQRTNKQKRVWRWFSALIVVATLLSGIFSSLIVRHWAQQPTKVMDAQLIAGKILMRSWNQLSKVEQEKIMRLGT